MQVYHGSSTIVKAPKIIEGKFTKDFGAGFYCTKFQPQAEKWSKKFDVGFVNIYEYIEDNSLSIKEFSEMTDEWLDFVVACRSGINHEYDIVIGPMADDQVYSYVLDYTNGIITREAFWILAKFKYPTHQIAFCTDASLKTINYVDSYEVKQ